jgi:hypothetical protein
VIVFNLKCAGGHGFEEWFASSADYEAKAAARVVVCPECGSTHIETRRTSRKDSQRRGSTAARRPRRLLPGRADCRPALAASARWRIDAGMLTIRRRPSLASLARSPGGKVFAGSADVVPLSQREGQ